MNPCRSRSRDHFERNRAGPFGSFGVGEKGGAADRINSQHNEAFSGSALALPGGPKPRGAMGRAIRYLANYKQQASFLSYLFLIIATLAQLAVPRMVRNVVDAVTSGYIADQILQALDKIPATFMSAALPKILEAVKYPAEWTVEQLKVQLEADVSSRTDYLDQRHHPHYRLRHPARSVRLPASLLGREKFAGGCV